jgi:tetratricopeptide (TPR) repeat protein
MTEPKHIAELRKRAGSLMKESRWLDAIKLLNDGSSGVGKYWKLSWNIGWCYFKLGRFEEAQRYMKRANKLAPENPICKWALGAVYLKKRQFKNAEAILAESLRIKESYPTRISLALAYLAQGKIAEAEKTHLDGLKLRTRRSERYESYAAFLSDVGREGEAERMNQKAIELRNVN